MKFVEIVSKNPLDNFEAYCSWDEYLYQAHKIAIAMAEKYGKKITDFKYKVHEKKNALWGVCVENAGRDSQQVSIFDFEDMEMSVRSAMLNEFWNSKSNIDYEDFMDINIEEYWKWIYRGDPKIEEDAF